MTNNEWAKVAGYIVGTVAHIFIYSCLVMLTWNLLLPELFNFPKLTFFQSVGLYILCVTLFKPTISLREEED